MTDRTQEQQDSHDADQLYYFWTEKGNMKRYCRYEQCINRFPLIRQAELNLELATLALDAAVDAESNTHYE